ncbi:hypothetical protein C1T28_12680 [Bacillus subtilis]|nr:hypothetical protein C1T25_03295 [Bacillus cereus]POO73772.1 hypothetical protein C1T28_12680 [Bacillus subtilis]
MLIFGQKKKTLKVLLVIYSFTNAPDSLSTFLHKVILFTGHLGVASGKCGFTTLSKFKHKKVEFPVL